MSTAKNNDNSTEQVLEYYKKYSQNRNLPKYFSGTSVSYLPPLVPESETPPPILKTPAADTGVIKIEINEAELANEISSNSSSLSPTGDKKLEWDNGADIGYASARSQAETVHKISSMPVLDHLKDIDQSNTNVPAPVPSTVITHSDSEECVGVLVFSSESSKNYTPKNNPPSNSGSIKSKITQTQSPSTSPPSNISKRGVSSSSNSDESELKFIDFQKTIEFLKKKIGLPGAHSTPNVADPRLRPKVGDSGSSSAKSLVHNEDTTSWSQGSSMSSRSDRRTGQTKNLPEDPDLMLTKDTTKSQQKRYTSRHLQSAVPTTSSAFLNQQGVHKNSKTKIVELSISTPININCTSVRTSETTSNVKKTVTPKAVQTEAVNYTNIATQFNFETKTSDTETVCRSEEHVNSGDAMADSASSFEYVSLNTCSLVINNRNLVKEESIPQTSISGVLKEIALVKSSSTELSNTSKVSSEEIDRHLEVLHKLFKTKKLSSNTKRRYIKKLLKQLNELETTRNDSSSSSDLFIPKRNSSKDDKNIHKVIFKDSNEIIPAQTVPDESSSDNCECKSSESRNGGSIEIQQEYEEGHADVKANTEIKWALYSGNSTAKNLAASDTFATAVSDPSKTLSAKDPMLRFAENERTYQLHWINNEISHLAKLKSILESKGGEPQQSSLSSTNTYSVGQKGCKGAERKYVIQTDLKLPSQTKINYLIDGKEYVVSDSQRSSSDGGNAVIADIKMSSDENQMNIKVRTLCSVCKRVVCVCVSERTIQSKFPSLATEYADLEPCFACHMTACICDKTSQLEGKATTVDSSKTNHSSGPSVEAFDKNSPADDLASSPQQSDLGGIFPDNYSSLQKIFKNCGCTTENPNCGCGFVRQLLDKFRMQLEKCDGISEGVQTDSLQRDKLTTTEAKAAPSLAIQTKRMYQESDNQTVKPDVGTEQLQVEAIAQDMGQQTQKLTFLSEVQTDDPGIETNSVQVSVDRDHIAVQATRQTLIDGVQTELLGANRNLQTVISMGDIAVQTVRETGVCQCVQTDDMYSTVGTETESLPRSTKGTTSLLDKTKRSSHAQAEFAQENAVAQTSMEALRQEVQAKSDQLSQALNANNQNIIVISRGIQTEPPTTDSSLKQDSTTTASSDLKTNGSSRVTCYCCKQKAFLAEVSYVHEGDDSLVVCSRCYYTRPRFCGHNYRYMCRCGNYCRLRRQGVRVCQCCGLAVSQCPNRAAGLKYTVTLQKEGSRERAEQGLKVLEGWSKKNDKNKENHNSRRKEDDRKNSLRREKKKKFVAEDIEEVKTSNYRNDGYVDKENAVPSLTDYLMKNKPEFIYSAEYRRQMLLKSRILREKQKDNVKLQFLENYSEQADKDKFKLFTGREMKEITKRNYKKLPEVKNKVLKQRQNMLRQADRVISNVFAKKVQKSILKGSGNFPIDRPLAT